MPNFPEFISKLAAAVEAVFSVSEETLDFDTQTANTILAGPTTGMAADPTFRALIAADLPSHSASHINRVAGITPTADTFDTNPSTLTNLTDGDWTTETGEGIKSLAADGIVGNIIFDMGATYPVLVIAWLNVHRASGAGTLTTEIDWSNDGTNWTAYPGSNFWSGKSGDLYRTHNPAFLYARYFRICTIAASTTNPSVFHVKGASVIAIQLL